MPSYRSDQIKIGKIYGWHVYVIVEIDHDEFCKIGSASRVDYRLSSLQGGNPRRLKIAKSWHLDNREVARKVELDALKAMADRRLPKSEWIKCPSLAAIEAVERVIGSSSALLRLSTEPRWSGI